MNPDTDGDGLSDSFELSAFIPPALVKPVTNPLLIDTDNDGLLDGEDDEPTTAGEGVFSGLVVKSIKYKDDKTTYFEELPTSTWNEANTTPASEWTNKGTAY